MTIALAATTVALQYGAMRSGKKAAKKAGKRAARQIMAEAAVEKEQRGRMQKQERGLTTAATAASGVRMSGSAAQHLDSMTAQHERELDWITQSAKSRARIAKKTGQAQATAIKWQGWTDIFNSAVSALPPGGGA